MHRAEICNRITQPAFSGPTGDRRRLMAFQRGRFVIKLPYLSPEIKTPQIDERLSTGSQRFAVFPGEWVSRNEILSVRANAERHLQLCNAKSCRG